jgi:hypothetical protein
VPATAATGTLEFGRIGRDGARSGHRERQGRGTERRRVPSPSLSKRLKASLNSAICSSVSWSAMGGGREGLRQGLSRRDTENGRKVGGSVRFTLLRMDAAGFVASGAVRGGSLELRFLYPVLLLFPLYFLSFVVYTPFFFSLTFGKLKLCSIFKFDQVLHMCKHIVTKQLE